MEEFDGEGLYSNERMRKTDKSRELVAADGPLLPESAVNNKIIIIMGLESVSASEDVIGDLPSPWATINS